MAQSYVLVVDPNPSTRRRVEEAFGATELGLLWARDADEASERANGHDIAVVLSATSLPRGNGYDLARDLRERHPAAAVFLLSGGFEVYNRQRAEEAGVIARLNKPVSAARLIEAVEEAIGPVVRTDPDAVADELPELPGGMMEPVDGGEPAVRAAPPPTGSERIATFLPRDYTRLPVVAVDPEVVGPALERAILEVLPEVVEGVLRAQLVASPVFRELVQEAVAAQLDEAVARALADESSGAGD